MGTIASGRDCRENGRLEKIMSNLVTERLRDYRRNLMARRLRAVKTKGPTPVPPPVPQTKPHLPVFDHKLRESHL